MGASSKARARANPEGVSPCLAGRQSMTSLEAVAILAHPQVKMIPNVLVDEARKIEKDGEYWIWA